MKYRDQRKVRMKLKSVLRESIISRIVCSAESPCTQCKADQSFLRNKQRPKGSRSLPRLRVVDLFSGCGGMTTGLVEAASRADCNIDLALAVDSDDSVMNIYKSTLGGAQAIVADLGTVFGDFDVRLTKSELALRRAVGPTDILMGGPPCQGHSDLNNHTRRSDPKNVLYRVMARAARVLRPKVVIIENVTAVQWDESDVVRLTWQSLNSCGYDVDGRVLDLRRLGIPQRRRRFILIASSVTTVKPALVLDQLASPQMGHPDRTVRWAIHDLLDVPLQTTYDTASRVTPENASRIAFMFDHGLYDLPNTHRPECHRDGQHSYVSMYGRLHWDKPAQTITTGFGSIGQGRYVHPQRRRTITPHEAARLQTFPDWFDFGANTRRGVLATVIGNAVPPLLMVHLGSAILPPLMREI